MIGAHLQRDTLVGGKRPRHGRHHARVQRPEVTPDAPLPADINDCVEIRFQLQTLPACPVQRYGPLESGLGHSSAPDLEFFREHTSLQILE